MSDGWMDGLIDWLSRSFSHMSLSMYFKVFYILLYYANAVFYVDDRKIYDGKKKVKKYHDSCGHLSCHAFFECHHNLLAEFTTYVRTNADARL